MKHKLPIVSATLLLATVGYLWRQGALVDRIARADRTAQVDAASPVSDTLPSDGNALVAEAARQVGQLPHLSGRLRQRTQLFGRQLAGSGRYRQWFDGEQFRYRIDLHLPVGSNTAHFMQLGDGRFVWTRREFPSGSQLQRVDRRLIDREVGLARQAGREPVYPVDVLALAYGLAEILERLNGQFDFGRPRTSTIGTENLPVYVVEGSWNQEALERHYPAVAKEVLEGELRRLPEPVPTHVELVLGRDAPLKLFPYRISLLRRDRRGTLRLMDLEFFSLSTSAPLRAADFRYDPGTYPVVDATESVLEKLLPPTEQNAQKSR